VGVDVYQPREAGVASEIDDRRAGGHGSVSGSYRRDALTGDYNDSVLTHLPAPVHEPPETDGRDLRAKLWRGKAK
jgi:hypothetical protein